MKFEIYRSSDPFPKPKRQPCSNTTYTQETHKGRMIGRWNIEIESLDDIMNLAKDLNEPLIIMTSEVNRSDVPCIEIYDDYRE